MSSRRLADTFTRLSKQNRVALIPYLCAGDPSLALTLQLMDKMVEGGADIIELGVPFSDPMADGPVIQRATERALKQGVSLGQVLDLVAQFRKTNQATPIVLMGYANPLERMGWSTFAQTAQAVGVDGVLVVDYPPEECVKFSDLLRQRNLDSIFLVAPTTSEERLVSIIEAANGYLYYVSLRGVTGAKNLDVSAIAEKIPLLKQRTQIPIGVGFGIQTNEDASAIAGIADAVVIGSRLIQVMEESTSATILENIYRVTHEFRQAIDKAHRRTP